MNMTLIDKIFMKVDNHFIKEKPGASAGLSTVLGQAK